jgi:hypothetical protein
MPRGKIVIAHLKSVTPYSQGKAYLVDRLDDGKESHEAYENRTWRERCHTTADGHIFIPPMAFQKSVASAAAYRSDKKEGSARWTKHFLSGVQALDPFVLPVLKDEVQMERLFVPSDGKKGGGKRVWKNFPVIPEWEGEFKFLILDQAIPEKLFRLTLEDAGAYIGVGRFRPERGGFYGRYEVLRLDWNIKS